MYVQLKQFIVSTFLLYLDLASKRWAIMFLSPLAEQYYPLWTKIININLKLHFNHGYAFSFLANQHLATPILLSISGIALAWFAKLLIQPNNKNNGWIYSLLFTGGLGNAISRYQHDAVVDFIELGIFHWPRSIFNFADIYILIAVTWWIYRSWRESNDMDQQIRRELLQNS